MSKKTRQHKNYKSTVYALTPISLALLFNQLDLFQNLIGINHAQQISLTILIVTAILWITELFPLYVTSFVVILLQITWLLPAINTMGSGKEAISKEVFLSPFFSDIILLFLGGFVLSATLHKFGLDQRVAGGNPIQQGQSLQETLHILLSAWLSAIV